MLGALYNGVIFDGEQVIIWGEFSMHSCKLERHQRVNSPVNLDELEQITVISSSHFLLQGRPEIASRS